MSSKVDRTDLNGRQVFCAMCSLFLDSGNVYLQRDIHIDFEVHKGSLLRRLETIRNAQAQEPDILHDYTQLLRVDNPVPHPTQY